MKKLLIFCLICLSSKMAFAQIEDELPINDSLYNSIEESNMLLYGDSKEGSAGKTFHSLKRFCPPFNVANQNISGLSWTVAISQTMTMQFAEMNGWSSNQISQEVFSYQFLYDLLPKTNPKSCKLGKDWIVETKNILEEIGTTTIKEYPFKTIDCNRRPTEQQIRKAHRYSVRSFNRIFEVSLSNEGISTGGKIFGIKRCLDRNHPVVLCIIADEQFRNLKSENWKPSYASKSSLQTIVIVGYDENRKAFEVMGQSANWGKQGFAYIHYQDLVMAKYGFEIIMNIKATPSPTIVKVKVQKPKPIPSQPTPIYNPETVKPSIIIADEDVTLSGELVVNEVIDYDKYEAVNIQRNQNGYYEMPRIYPKYSQFQLISQKSQVGSYVYVFSIDPSGKAEIHYPFQCNPNKPNEVYGMSVVSISPVIPNENTQVVIPTPRSETDENGNTKRIERALSKELSGTDWLVVLHSDRRLEGEINELVAQLYQHNSDFMKRFKQVFGDRLIDKQHVNYTGASFKANTKKGYIVPMIIKLEAN